MFLGLIAIALAFAFVHATLLFILISGRSLFFWKWDIEAWHFFCELFAGASFFYVLVFGLLTGALRL